jgi:hypothetical protein
MPIALKRMVSSTFTGNQILNSASAYLAMQKSDKNSLVTQAQAFYFEGYSNSAIDSDRLMQIWFKVKSYCAGSDVTVEQMQSVSAKYIVDNPQERNLPAFLLIINSLKKAFPCDEQKK